MGILVHIQTYNIGVLFYKTDFDYKNYIKMIRKSTLDSIGPLVLEAIEELFAKCKENMLDDGDFLYVSQNGLFMMETSYRHR